MADQPDGEPDPTDVPGEYANIREIDQLGPILGCRLVDVTQHDEDEWQETKQAYVCLHFDNGTTVTFPIGDDGFTIDAGDTGDDEDAPGDGGDTGTV